jgi:protein-arginine kinase activator protein McsA
VIQLSPAVTRQQRLKRAEAELREAVAAEDFARAAAVREKIAAIKRGE